MDPNATLRMIESALESGDREAAKDSRRDLVWWMERGGFAPDWEAYPRAAAYVRRMM